MGLHNDVKAQGINVVDIRYAIIDIRLLRAFDFDHFTTAIVCLQQQCRTLHRGETFSVGHYCRCY